MSAHTPTPWREGNEPTGSIVADEPVPGLDGSDDTDFYGGHLVAESVTPSNREFIVRACNAHDDLLAAAQDAQCACSIKERDSGHLAGCWMPALQEAIAKAEGPRP